MKRDEIRGVEESQDLPQAPEDGVTGAKATTNAQWLEAGAEDPAFFIKPSDED